MRNFQMAKLTGIKACKAKMAKHDKKQTCGGLA